MLRQLTKADVEAFQSPKIVALQDVVTDSVIWKEIREEAEKLAAKAKPLTSNPHSAYDQVNPTELVRDPLLAPTLLRLYHSDDMKRLVKQLTSWESVHCLPLTTDGRFEINCKTNVYLSSKQSYLGWHFDRTFNYRGNQVVAVLTLENTSDKPNLEALPLDSWSTQHFHLGANSLTVHVPDKVFHRVLQLQPRADGGVARRIVFVMRFTDDPTPVEYSLLSHARFLATHPLRFAIVGDVKWLAILAVALVAIWVGLKRLL